MQLGITGGVDFLNDAAIDESEMSMTICFADGNDRDGVGDLTEVTGINTSRHRIIPSVLFDHGKEISIPIAIAEEPGTGRYTCHIDGVAKKGAVRAYFYQGGLKHQSVQWEETESVLNPNGVPILARDNGREYDHSVECNQLFDLVCKKFLRGGSFGYQIIEAYNLQPDYRKGHISGLHLVKTLMLEVSLVVMPCNMSTAVQSKELCREILGKSWCGKELHPRLKKTFEVLAV